MEVRIAGQMSLEKHFFSEAVVASMWAVVLAESFLKASIRQSCTKSPSSFSGSWVHLFVLLELAEASLLHIIFVQESEGPSAAHQSLHGQC